MLIMEVKTESQQPGETLHALAVRWSRLRVHADGIASPVPLIAEGLSLRARRLLDQIAANTVQELLAFDPEELVERENVGRTTVAALIIRAQESLPPANVDAGLPDFIEVTDMILKALPERARRIIAARFEKHVRSIDVARNEGVSRERVRQIEEKFVQRLRMAIRRHKLALDNVLNDDIIEYDELSAGRYDGRHAADFYVSLARAVLSGGDSYVDVERYYVSQVLLLAGEIRNDDDFILGRFAVQRAAEMAKALAPALSELGSEALWERLKTELGARDTGGRLVGRKPQVGRIIRALLRTADAPVNVSLLVNQLRMVLGTYGEVSYFDNVRLRNKLFSMEGVHMHDEQTASLEMPDPAVAQKWLNTVVGEIRKVGKPYSLVRFLDDYEDTPFDAFGFASLLKSDERVVHVGRRLYAPAEYEAEGPLRIAALIQEALQEAGGPMTRGELLAYVKDRRDLISTQMDHYFRGVAGLVAYTSDIVGLVPLDRTVMLQMLRGEDCVASLIRDRNDGSTLLHISSLWLLADDEPDLSKEEEKTVVKAGRKWKTVVVKESASGLFFGSREDE
jgi:hypothetical protein